MSVPQEHQLYLQRTGYAPGQRCGLSAEEAALLDRYGHWLEALASGAIAPATPQQRQFLLVAQGQATPQTPFERVWRKLRATDKTPPERPVAFEAEDKVAQLADAKRYLDDLQARQAAERQAVLNKVRAELDAVEARHAEPLSEANRAVADLEAEVRAEVLRLGKSLGTGPLRVLYCRGRTTWDSKGLASYAAGHPEIERFRKVGEPSVQIRYPRGGPAESLPAPPHSSDDEG